MKRAFLAVGILAAFLLGAAIAWRIARPKAELPDERALVMRVREVARLQSLDVTLYKKVDFAPDPRVQDSIWASVSQWATYAVRPPRGRAIVFAQAHLAVDLRKLDAGALRVSGRSVQVVLPKLETQVELLPSETEVIGSNLDTAQTAELFDKARTAFALQVASDIGLQERARQSAQSTLRSLFLGLGFTQVDFVPRLAPATARN
ncbi:MAG TPA: DUF4230 domain-containing protein [Myxococcales bacterium]